MNIDEPTPNQFRVIKDDIEILDEIGKGGFGKVYKIRDNKNGGKIMAMKILLPIREIQPDPDNPGEPEQTIIRRFKKEISFAISIEHINIVRGYEPVIFESSIGYTMEFINGSNLDEYLYEFSGRMNPAEMRHIIQEMLEALVEIHRHNILHRDLKLANIILSENQKFKRVVKVADFGLIRDLDPNKQKLTRANTAVGTFGYLPPEYFFKGIFNEQSDLYACGLILYELISGKPRFDNSIQMPDELEQIKKVVYKHPKLKVAPEFEYLAKIAEKALSLNPEDRFESAQEMLDVVVGEKKIEQCKRPEQKHVSRQGFRINVYHIAIVLLVISAVLTVLILFTFNV